MCGSTAVLYETASAKGHEGMLAMTQTHVMSHKSDLFMQLIRSFVREEFKLAMNVLFEASVVQSLFCTDICSYAFIHLHSYVLIMHV